MNYITSTSSMSRVLIVIAIIAGVLGIGMSAYAQVTGQAGLGDRGANVTALQTYLAADPKIYPQALVTGYFGDLTEAAVRNFQIGYALPAVGRVGPLTLAKIASLVASGRPIDVSSPVVTNSSVSGVSGSRATVSWNTNEAATGKIHYSASPITGIEATQSKMEPTMSGTAVMSGNLAGTSHSVSLTNLTRDTTYYYAIMATDVQGNVTVHDWNKTFRTD